MNELKRSAKRTREQLTFSDTYLVLDNLREYDFDLVSFYVTFNQYIDRRNYEGKAENSLIFANNEALFKAFNVSRNRFYRLLKLAYECGLIDIEKGSNNRNIYILNDTIPFEPLEKIRDWKIRNGHEEDGNMEEVCAAPDKDVKTNEEGNIEEPMDLKSYPKKGQPDLGQPLVPFRDNQSSRKRITTYPEKGQQNQHQDGMDSSINTGPNISNVFNRSKGFNISKSISQSIDRYDHKNNGFKMNIIDKLNNLTDGQDGSTQQMEKIDLILEQCEVHLVDKDYRDAVIHALRLLLLDIENKKVIKIGDNLVPTDMIKRDMDKLDFLVIDHAISKFKKASREKEIKNTVVYLKSCIYNSIYEMRLDVESEMKLLFLREIF
ncbi:hypothetical protein [Alkaliphilus sp. B6464]|uniref:hypothetical protein n=1 Tax=Alkaliphilus sp. B6464 TaxID=2731219 RepID=UPI001BA68B72|nr:hypothetical protein [Alkaliphilus sp. B6464]QUH20406.1 hypothetical protein HYG84_11195 [Alkaliphilus sp. B6464]